MQELADSKKIINHWFLSYITGLNQYLTARRVSRRYIRRFRIYEQQTTDGFFR